MSISLSAQSSLTYGEYEKQLSDFQGRDQKLREQIAQEQALILDVKNKIDSTQKNINDIRRKKLETLGITADDVESVLASFDALIKELRTMINLSDDRFMQDSARLTVCASRLDSLMAHPAARLRIMEQDVKSAGELAAGATQRLEQLLAASAEKIKAAAVEPVTADKVEKKREFASGSSYTVRKSGGKPETLYYIAEQLYGDARLWPKIYRANRQVIDANFRKFHKGTGQTGIIDASDLILPGQVLEIPR